MGNKIEARVQESLKIACKKFKDELSVKRFEESKEEFKELVKRGVAHERGNNLLSTSDAHIKKRVVFNVNNGY